MDLPALINTFRSFVAALLLVGANAVFSGDTPHKAIAAQIETPNTAVLDLVFAPDGKSIYETGHDKVIRQWSVETRALLRSFAGHTETVYSLALSPDGTRLASGGSDETIRLWNTATGEQLLLIKGAWRVVDTLQFTSNGERLVVGGLNNTLDIYDATSGQMLQTLPTRHGGDQAAPFALSPDGSRIAAGGEDGKVSVWDLKTGAQLFRTDKLGNGECIHALRYIDGGKRIAALNSEAGLRELNAETGEVEGLAQYQSANGNPVVFSNDGRHAATSHDALLIDIGEPSEIKSPFNFSAIHRESRALAFAPDNRFFATTHGNTIVIWNMNALKP
jgi:WD40 repeat protein